MYDASGVILRHVMSDMLGSEQVMVSNEDRFLVRQFHPQ